MQEMRKYFLSLQSSGRSCIFTAMLFSICPKQGNLFGMVPNMHYLPNHVSVDSVKDSTYQKQVKEKAYIKKHGQQKTDVQPVLSLLAVFWRT